jgi:hypothetical protein
MEPVIREEAMMHPMFVELYLEGDPAEVLDEESKRRAARARRARSRAVVRVTVPDRGRQPRR